MKPNTRLMPAASSETPKLRRNDASARGSVMTCRNRVQSMPALRITSAVSGSSTMAQRKKVVNPSVMPKPGITLGSRWLFMYPYRGRRPARARIRPRH